MSKKTAIIILNYNDWKTTINMVQKIGKYQILDYIIVVDNKSTDDSLYYLKKICGNNIKLLVAKENKGYAAGNNIGVRYAIKELEVNNIIISNPDIMCNEESMSKIINVLEQGYSMATGVIHNRVGNGEFKIFSSFAWRVPNYIDLLINCFPIMYKINRCVLKKSIYYDYKDINKKNILDVEAISGCFFSIKANVLEDVGFFDERTFLYYEENILAYKLKKKGYKVAVCTDAMVYHCENPKKNSNLQKLLLTCRITLNSADIYIQNYLGKNSWKIKLYHFCFWIGRIENLILKKILKK